MRLAGIICFIIFILPGRISFCQVNGYDYTLDLSTVKNDRVFVALIPPTTNRSEIGFNMPGIIPGAYALCDFGRFLNNLEATDKRGNRLPVERVGVNRWIIRKADRLHKITYWADDTSDSKEVPEIFWPAGTNIELNQNFLINPSGFFGYLDNMKDVPFRLKVIRPADFYGATGLVRSADQGEGKSAGPSDRFVIDNYITATYEELVDSPLMYNYPDTARLRIGNTLVLVASHSPNKMVSAKEISASIEDVLIAQKDFLGGHLPVEKYAFIFYFTDQPVMEYGALEHSHSSVYYMPEDSITGLKEQLRDIAAHEFLHILTPLTIHSEQIHDFDFATPDMSQHLWLYEGVTEYFAGLVQVRYGLISKEKFLHLLLEKMHTSDRFIKDVAFTEISENIHDRYHDQFYNVYHKGALIAMCLDLKLLKLSSGEYGLRELMLDLSKRFGKEKPFVDHRLFDEITEMTYPDLREFFNRYVKGIEELPLGRLLDYVGIEYLPQHRKEDYSLGISREEVDVTDYMGKPRLQISSTEKQNTMGSALGLQQGDILVSINNEVLPDLGPELGQTLKRIHRSLSELDTLSYKVMRRNESGEWKETFLSAPVKKTEIIKRHILEFKAGATEEQLALRDAWLKP